MISCALPSYMKPLQVQPIDSPRIYIYSPSAIGGWPTKCTTPACSWQAGVGGLMPSIDGTNYFLV